MKNLLVALVLLFSVHKSYANTLIVSDVDDTIKVTNVLNKAKMVANGLFSLKAFSGMSELYKELKINESVIFYVSGSGKFLRGKVSHFLVANDFPTPENLILKKISDSIFDYKLREIRNLIVKNKPDSIIFIGDDTEHDPEIYDTLSKENIGKVKSIYIRSIQNRKLPENLLIKSFLTSVEVAASESLKNNMSARGLHNVAIAFIEQRNKSVIQIEGRYCPREGSAQIEELKHMMNDRLSINSLEMTQEKLITACTNLDD